jgi:RimJ/RimL family protein N-acetyltransferase
MRLLPQYEGFGYAKEALLTLMSYAFYELNMELITAKCHKFNDKSRKTLISTGLRPNGEDDTFFYFYKTAAM